MTETHAEIVAATKAFLMREVLPGEDPDELQASTPLLSSGVLDSISTVKLVGFLEDTFGVEFDAHEITEDHLDSLDGAAKLVLAKRGA